jgi:hypothetical protein
LPEALRARPDARPHHVRRDKPALDGQAVDLKLVDSKTGGDGVAILIYQPVRD